MTLATHGGVHDVGHTWRGAGRWPDREGCMTLATHGGVQDVGQTGRVHDGVCACSARS